MDTTPNQQLAEPDRALVARADERLAHAYAQIARADEQLAQVAERLSNLNHDAAPLSSPQPGRRRSGGRPALRGLLGLLLAASIVAFAFVWQSSYAETAKLVVAHWAPRLGLASLLPAEKTALLAQPGPATVQIAAAEPASAPPGPPALTSPQSVAQTAAPASPELAQLLQTMARDLANLELGIAQLKASQEQMATSNAKAIEELKAGEEQLASDQAKAAAQIKASQEQIASLLAKASEPNPRPKTSAGPSQPAGKPVSTVRSAQARGQPQTPLRLQPEKRGAADGSRR